MFSSAALEGLARLKENNGRFTLPESSVKALQDYRETLNPLITFCSDCVSDGSGITFNALYEVYNTWCRGTNRKPRSRGKLLRQDLEKAIGVECQPRGDGKMQFFPGKTASYQIDLPNPSDTRGQM